MHDVHVHFISRLTKLLEMGRSSADTEVRPNVRLGSARQHVTIRPKFGRTSANIRRHLWLRTCGVLPLLHSLLAVAKVNILTVSY